MALCAATIPLLASSGRIDVAAELTTIHALIQSGAMTKAFEAYRNLPRYDIVFLRENMDWMFSEHERVPVAEKALATAYYSQTLRALGDLRVSVLYGFERPLIDSSPTTVQQLATELVSTLHPRADGI